MNERAKSVVVVTDVENQSGIANFSKKWLEQFATPYTLVDGKRMRHQMLFDHDHFMSTASPKLRDVKCVIYDYYWDYSFLNAENVPKFDLYSCFPPSAKKIFVVHEIGWASEYSLRHADFIVYITKYQEMVGDILGLTADHMCMGGLPRDKEQMDNKGYPYIYFGGHYIALKRGLLDRMRHALELVGDCNARIILRMNAPPHSERDCRNFQYEIQKIKASEIGSRVEIHTDFLNTYEEMLEEMSMCKWSYLFRNDIPLDYLYELYEKRSPELSWFYMGDSGMMRDAYMAGCELLVEKKARFATYFDRVKYPTWKHHARVLGEICNMLI